MHILKRKVKGNGYNSNDFLEWIWGLWAAAQLQINYKSTRTNYVGFWVASQLQFNYKSTRNNYTPLNPQKMDPGTERLRNAYKKKESQRKSLQLQRLD